MSTKRTRPPQPDGADYEVGFGRPPVHTRFQPGRSGNPAGRPKGKPNFATAFQDELDTPVTITEGGRTRTITKLQAIVKQLVNRAASGDARAMQLLLAAARLHDTSEQDTPPPLSHEADEQIKRDLMRRLAQFSQLTRESQP